MIFMGNPHLPDGYLDEATSDEEKIFNDRIAALALMPPHQYGNERKAISKEYNLPVNSIDAELQKHRNDNLDGEDTPKNRREINLYEPELWHQPVNGANALDEAANILKRHMVMSESDVYACVLWAAHTHLFKQFSHTPRLLISAPAAECGKTLLMTHLVGNLVTKPLPVEMMSPAPFFRLAEKSQPVFLIDEADIFFRSDSELPAAINGGFEPHGGVLRCVGDDNDVQRFSTHCPVALAGINVQKKLPSSTVSRCIVISLDRAMGNEIQDEDIYTDLLHKQDLLTAGRKLARWASDNVDRISKLKPKLPHGVRNRMADKWSPLFAIAEVLGGIWPERAIMALYGQVDLSEPTKSQLLLSDIHEVMKENLNTNIGTIDLIDRLCQLDESPWREYNFKEYDLDKRKISSRQLSNLLKEYKIHRGTVRVGNNTVKGYKGKDLNAAYERYLSDKGVTQEKKVTRSQSTQDVGCSDYGKVTRDIDVTDTEMLRSPLNDGCDPVTHNRTGAGPSKLNNRVVEEI